jgi:hypothetical protein
MTGQGRAMGISAILLTAAGSILGSPLLCMVAVGQILILMGAHRWTRMTTQSMNRIHIRNLRWIGVDDLDEHLFGLTIESTGLSRPIWLNIRLRCSAFTGPSQTTIQLPANVRGECQVPAKIKKVGRWNVDGIDLEWNGLLTLYQINLQYAVRLPVTIWPNKMVTTKIARPSADSPAEWSDSARTSRRLGQQGDVRELREYNRGDPARAIAWKATARHDRLLVRRYEETFTSSVQILLNVGPAMRNGAIGLRPLDAAIQMTRSLIDRHGTDRIGMVIFDHRIISMIPAATGRKQKGILLESLLSIAHLCDRDLTEVSEAEVIAHVSGYLQERLAWADAPHLYLDQKGDLATILESQLDDFSFRKALEHYEHIMNEGQHLSRPDGTPIARLARDFCQRERIELPYRLSGPDLYSRRGFTAAFQRAILDRAEQIYCLDVDVAIRESDQWMRAEKNAQRRGIQLRKFDCTMKMAAV